MFRVTRDADFEVSDDADDLLEAVETQLRRRRFGDVVRVEVSSSASSEMVARLQSGLGADETQIYRVRGPLDLLGAARAGRARSPGAEAGAVDPVIPPRLRACRTTSRKSSMRSGAARSWCTSRTTRTSTSFEVFARQPFGIQSVIADEDRRCTARAKDSVLVEVPVPVRRGGEAVRLPRGAEGPLRRAAQHRVVGAVEQAGVHVAYGFPDLKIHAKMTLIVRREGDGLRRYAHIGTGNYHAATARLYEDLGIFTADEDITADVADLFNYITGFGRPQKFRKLLVAPFTLRSGLVDEIRAVAAAASAGKHARIRLKLNHLVDPEDRRRALLQPHRRVPGSTSSPARRAHSDRVSRASRRTSTSARSSGASSSTAVSTPSRPTSASPRTSAAPISCSATSTTASRC